MTGFPLDSVSAREGFLRPSRAVLVLDKVSRYPGDGAADGPKAILVAPNDRGTDGVKTQGVAPGVIATYSSQCSRRRETQPEVEARAGKW